MNSWELSPGWAIDWDVELDCVYVRFGQLVVATVRTTSEAIDLLNAIGNSDTDRFEIRYLQPIPWHERLALLAAVKGGLA